MTTRHKFILIRSILAVLFLTTIIPLGLSINVCAGELGSSESSVIVSMGDSYSSGEGIEPFMGQDLPLPLKVKNYDWIAHRSENAWSGMLTLPSLSGTMAENADDWYFVAASGATTAHIAGTYNREYYKKYSFDATEALHGSVPLPPQISIFDVLKEDGKTADYVTLTIGGNDVGFCDLVKVAVCSSTYLSPAHLTDMINMTWHKFFYEGIRANICTAYERIHDAAGEDTQIIVAGYPKLLDPDGSIFLFSEDAANSLNTAVSQFNDELKSIVHDYRLFEEYNIWFVSVEEAFQGHGAYSDDPYLHGVIPITHLQDINDSELISSYSMHPDYTGACAYAECVQKKIDELEGVLSESSNTRYNTDVLLSVYDINNTAYDDYTIDITGTYNTGWFGWTWFGWFEKDFSAHIVVNDSTPQAITLNPNGNYVITIRDNKDGSKIYSKNIEVSNEYPNKRINFSTNFGAMAVYMQSDVPPDAFEFNGHYYYVYNINTGTTWEEAKQYCESQGGYLATITSPEEQAFISSLVQNQKKRSYWIGLTDEEESGDWKWVTDEPFSYSNWGQNEPNHGYGGKEHYVAIVSYDTEYDYPIFRGEWNDHANDRDIGQFGFICEWGEYSTNFTSPSEDKIEMNGAFGKYLAAVSKTTESGSWTEQLTLEADLFVTNGSSKTKTKMTLNSTSDVSNYAEGNLSNIEVSSISDMTIMGQTYAWSTEYQDGVAHYQYTEPVQTSQDLEIDPNFFDFNVITQEAIINEEISGNQLRFTISGDSMAAAGIAAVEQINGVDNLKYGDVEVTVTLSNLDTVETIIMVFDASMEYQGFNSDVSYHIQYRFV